MSIIGVGYNPTKREVIGNQEFVKGGISEYMHCPLCHFNGKPCAHIECYNEEASWTWIEVKSCLSVNKEKDNG